MVYALLLSSEADQEPDRVRGESISFDTNALVFFVLPFRNLSQYGIVDFAHQIISLATLLLKM